MAHRLTLVVTAIAIAIASCGRERPDRAAELEACRLISKSGDALAECLIMKYSWRADSAGPAKYAWQRHLDSLRLEHEQQVATLIAQQEARDREAARAQRLASARRATPWAQCIIEQWDAHGANWSYQPCQKQRPEWDDLSTYIQVRKVGGDTMQLLIRAHVHSMP